MGEARNVNKILSENLKGRGHLEDLGIDCRMILDWILEKMGRQVWTGFIGLSIGTGDRLL
jgi:hypothetical protein